MNTQTDGQHGQAHKPLSAETKFTPGPWRVLVIAPNNLDAGTAMVATPYINGMAMDCAQSGATFAQSAANAMLVAAAPDMYVAATACLAHLDRINPPNGAYWSGAGDQEDLRAALRKARGESE